MKTLTRPFWHGRSALRDSPLVAAQPPDLCVPLKPETFHDALRALIGRPAANTYLLGCMETAGPSLFHGRHGWYGLIDADTGGRASLRGVAHIGRTVHIAWTGPAHRAPIAQLARLVGARDTTATNNVFKVDSSEPAVRAMVGPDVLIAALVRAVAARSALPRRIHERGPQRALEVTRAMLTPFARTGRLVPAAVRDLPDLIEADRAMLVAEIGVDPVSAVPDAYVDASLARIAERRTWLIADREAHVAFKVDVAAQSSEAAIIAGVHTRPDARRQGLARAGIGELCHYLLRDVPRVILHVYEDNAPALALYSSLGFREVGRTRSVWFA